MYIENESERDTGFWIIYTGIFSPIKKWISYVKRIITDVNTLLFSILREDNTLQKSIPTFDITFQLNH